MRMQSLGGKASMKAPDSLYFTRSPQPPVKGCRFSALAKIPPSLAVKVLYTRPISQRLALSGFFSLFFGRTEAVLWHCHFTEQRTPAAPSRPSHTGAMQLEAEHHQGTRVQACFWGSGQQFPFGSVYKLATSFFFFKSILFHQKRSSCVPPLFPFLSLNMK